MADPISIRTKNPGAMWGGRRAEKWGATADILTGDSEGNHIAVFPTMVQGAAAQFDLWRAGYAGLTLGAAITRWSGGNSSPAYVAFLEQRTGLRSVDLVTVGLLSGPKGIALMKAQAAWECGWTKDGYPMTDAEWQRAQHMVFPGSNPAPPPDVPPPAPASSGGFWSTLLSILRKKV